ncbi:hypothetical protein AB4Z18_08540 [Leifsonia sp. 2TAF2]|uniref:hypothetical protein n=1 Tax=Leifsonia sp. 2TAF2 TaxID=3233009 RepID=UPI003F978CF2
MNTTGWIILIVVVVVVIAVIAIIATVGRNRKREADRRRAEEMRQSAAQTELDARDREAKAARAAADAKQAEVDAERLRREAEERESSAASARSESEEAMRRADHVDPDVRTDKNGNRIDDGTRTDAAAPAGTTPAGTARTDATAGTVPPQDATVTPADDDASRRTARHEAPRFDDGTGRTTP